MVLGDSSACHADALLAMLATLVIGLHICSELNQPFSARSLIVHRYHLAQSLDMKMERVEDNLRVLRVIPFAV